MAQITYRANLSARSFPFLSQNWGRTVIVPQYDNAFNRQVTSPSDADSDVGIPQIYYCHNVMPHQQGFQSVGYINVYTSGGATNARYIHLIRDGKGNKLYLVFTSDKKIYRYKAGVSTLHSAVDYDITNWTGELITTALVGGITYIYVPGVGVAYFDFETTTFTPVTLTGLNVGAVIGITAAFGYLIAWNIPGTGFTAPVQLSSTINCFIPYSTLHYPLAAGQPIVGTGIPPGTTIVSYTKVQHIFEYYYAITLSLPATVSTVETLTFGNISNIGVAWSSIVDPTDFTPSLTTGAGGGDLEAAKGKIVACVPHAQGFIIYTESNIVAATYSGNSRYPFNFREIPGSAGISDINQVTFDSNSGNHYVYTTSGLQLVNTTQSQIVLPELTDFISGKLLEDYNETTDTFSQTLLTTEMKKELTMVSDRYLVISYGIASYTHALVYEISAKRWGKLKQAHVTCFDFLDSSSSITEAPRQSIGFLNSDGSIVIADFTDPKNTYTGVICLGKYQFVRQRLLQLDQIFLENITSGTTPVVKVLTALDGKNVTSVTPSLITSTGLFRSYGCRAIGINHSLLIKGSFTLTSLELTFNIHGKR